MCGICGVIGIERVEQAEAITRRMMDSIRHRGPDDDGLLLAPSVAFGMRRLSIIDLSGGRQPVFNEAGNVAVVFNGEIYNYQPLRGTLEARVHVFRTRSDTEVIVHGYEEWGEDCLRELRGMFAFALWDARDSGTSGDTARHAKVFIARDRLGIKPLYFYHSGNQLIFASEIKALLASGLVPRQLDPAGLRAYLQLGHIPPPFTAIRGVTPLAPGHIGVWRDGKWRTNPYWTLNPHGTSPPPPEQLASNLSEVFVDAMRHHLVSDVPVLLFLSGGTDSACLAAAARKAGAQNLSAMTVGFGEAEFDETELSRRTARALDITHQVVTLYDGRLGANLDHAISAKRSIIWRSGQNLSRVRTSSSVLPSWIFTRTWSRVCCVISMQPACRTVLKCARFFSITSWSSFSFLYRRKPASSKSAFFSRLASFFFRDISLKTWKR